MDILESLIAPIGFVFAPEKRIYWLYLLSSAIIAVMISGRQAFKRKRWLNRSSALDLIWLCINQFFFKLLVVPLLALQISFSFSINHGLAEYFGSGNFFSLSPFCLALLFTFTLFVGQDFAKYLIHVLFHKVPWLWRFHAVHHSATSMTPLTLYRLHPVEMLINALRSVLIGALITGLFLYLFKEQLSFTSILGVNLFVFIFNIAGSNLRHSPVWLGFNKAEYVFISPAQHQIHHSVKIQHYDKNFGSALAIWDLLFATLKLSKKQQVDAFGINSQDHQIQTFRSQWWGIKN